MKLVALREILGICRLAPTAPVPSWAWGPGLVSVTTTAEELSIVCAQDRIPGGSVAERAWRALKVLGPLNLDSVGILAGLSAVLADAGVALFALSTYDTDYLLVREPDLARAAAALRAAGHDVEVEGPQVVGSLG